MENASDPAGGRLPGTVTLGVSPLALLPMALGGSVYAPEAGDAERLGAMEAAYEGGIRHFDTAASYGNGHQEELLGRFLLGRRESVFVASKAHGDDLSAAAMLTAVEASLRRLRLDYIDLYYVHWPRSGRDMRPTMEGLEQARRQGKIGAIGVSNFTVAQMQQVSQAGRIDAHQLGYNLLWRFAERDVIPYCVANGISVIAYSALAHGILTGKFGATPKIAAGDQRHTILPFQPAVWPHVHAGVETMKQVAADLDIPLAALAVRWSLGRAGIHSVVVGARDGAQAAANLGLLTLPIPADAFPRLTAISDDLARHMPDAGNLFGYFP